MQKSSTILQAQIERFALTEGRATRYTAEDRDYLGHVLRNSMRLAKLQSLEETNELDPALMNLLLRFRDEYVTFLRSPPNQFVHQELRVHAHALEAARQLDMDKIRLQVDALRLGSKTLKKHPEYVGDGGEGIVFNLDFLGKKAVIKYFYENDSFRSELETSVRGDDISKVPRLLAIDWDNMAIVMTKMPGIRIDKLQDSIQYSDQCMLNAIRTLIEIAKRKLTLDPMHGGNILYSPDDGFSFIDLKHKFGKEAVEHDDIIAIIDQFCTALCFTVEYPNDQYRDSMSYYRSATKHANRMLHLLKNNMPDILNNIQNHTKILNNMDPIRIRLILEHECRKTGVEQDSYEDIFEALREMEKLLR